MTPTLTPDLLLDHFAESPPTVVLVFDDGEAYERPLTSDQGFISHPLDALPACPIPGLAAVVVICTGTAFVEDGYGPGRVRIAYCMTRDDYGQRTVIEGRGPLPLDTEPQGAIPDRLALMLGRAA